MVFGLWSLNFIGRDRYVNMYLYFCKISVRVKVYIKNVVRVENYVVCYMVCEVCYIFKGMEFRVYI